MQRTPVLGLCSAQINTPIGPKMHNGAGCFIPDPITRVIGSDPGWSSPRSRLGSETALETVCVTLFCEANRLIGAQFTPVFLLQTQTRTGSREHHTRTALVLSWYILVLGSVGGVGGNRSE